MMHLKGTYNTSVPVNVDILNKILQFVTNITEIKVGRPKEGAT